MPNRIAARRRRKTAVMMTAVVVRRRTRRSMMMSKSLTMRRTNVLFLSRMGRPQWSGTASQI
eukprot:3067254-Pleurochrysis_carterae.AAC.1